MKFQPPKGTRDIWGNDFYFRQNIANTILKVTEKYGFRQVQTPMIESMELLAKDAGEEVTGQIYQVTDKAGRILGLKSDITPALTRLIANNSKDLPKPIKLSCYDRIYRYERPQKGRYREISQINAEMFGAPTGIADAEVLTCFYDCYQQLGITNIKIQVGFRPLLENFIASLGIAKTNTLSIIRIIDKKEKITDSEFIDELTNAGLSKQNIIKVQQFTSLKGRPNPTIKKAKKLITQNLKLTTYLSQIELIFGYIDPGILSSFEVNFGLARGSEYYTGIIFEARLDDQAQSIGGGGRYDNLVEFYGGFSMPAVGFSIGIDRVELIITELQSGKVAENQSPRIDFFIISSNNSKSLLKKQQLARKLRNQGYNVEIDLQNKSISKQIALAKKLGTRKIIHQSHIKGVVLT